MKCCKAIYNDMVIIDHVYVADTFFERLRGLTFKKKLSDNEGLLIAPCRQIHSYGMRFIFDAVFISNSGEILHIIENMNLCKVSPYIKNCSKVLEIKAGTVSRYKIETGNSISFKE